MRNFICENNITMNSLKIEHSSVFIVMPCYNWEKYLLEQLMSIYYQNYTNWYLIFVNDWSTDNSENVIRDWISHYNLHKKVKVINKENGGVTSAVQRWLEEVKTMCNIGNNSFISYCDSDDIRSRDKLQKQVEYMLNEDYWLSFHDLVCVNEHWVITKPSQLRNEYKKDLSFFYFATVWNLLTSTWMMFKLSFLDYLLPMPVWKYIYQDTWTTLVLSLIWCKIWYIDMPLWYYRQWHQSLIWIAKKSDERERYICRQKIYKSLQNRFPKEDLNYIINYNFDRYVKWYDYWLISFRSYLLMLLKYPRVFFISLRTAVYKFFRKIF